MKEKIKNWLKVNKKDIKKLLIGGVIFALYILFFQLIGEKTDINIIEAFFAGILLTAIFINAYRFFWQRIFKTFRHGSEKTERLEYYGMAKEEIDNYNKDKK